MKCHLPRTTQQHANLPIIRLPLTTFFKRLLESTKVQKSQKSTWWLLKWTPFQFQPMPCCQMQRLKNDIRLSLTIFKSSAENASMCDFNFESQTAKCRVNFSSYSGVDFIKVGRTAQIIDCSIHLRPTPTPNFLRSFLLAQKLGARA